MKKLPDYDRIDKTMSILWILSLIIGILSIISVVILFYTSNIFWMVVTHTFSVIALILWGIWKYMLDKYYPGF
jgi:hypothetical protein